MKRQEKNSQIMSEKLFDVINQVLDGSIDPNIADVAFNGAGKWIALQKVRLEYKSYKGQIGEISELEDSLLDESKQIESRKRVA
jgi:hypothetical protein